MTTDALNREGPRSDGPEARLSPAVPSRPDAPGLDDVVQASLRPVALGLTLLYGVFAVAHTLVLDGPAATVMTGLATASALGFAGAFIVLGRNEVSERWAHPVATGFALLVLGNSAAHLYLTGDPLQTTNLALLVLGAGLVLLDPAYFAVVVVSTFAGFLLVVGTAPGADGWGHFGFFLLAATVLAGAVLAIRRRTLGRMKALQRHDRVRQLELEAALERTENAREGEEEARRALEGAVSQLRESEERFRRLADATLEGVAIHRDGRIVDANRGLAELVGTSPSALVGHPVTELFAPDSRDEVAEALARSRDREVTMEATGLRADGSRFPAEVSSTPTRGQAEPVTVTVVRDATSRRRSERRLVRAAEEARDRDRAKSAFLATMSHELRAPLTAVVGFTEELGRNREGHLSDREVDYLDRLRVNARHLLELVDDILDLSRIETGRLELESEDVELAELVQDVLVSAQPDAERKGLRLEAEIPEVLQTVRADARRLRQVLANLVNNAVTSTPSGMITVAIEAEDGLPRRLRVSDTGIGISEDRLPRIFDPFAQGDISITRRSGGAGLGLTISRSLCRMMGFELAVRSREGVGSTFTVDFAPEEVGGGEGTAGVEDGAPAAPGPG